MRDAGGPPSRERPWVGLKILETANNTHDHVVRQPLQLFSERLVSVRPGISSPELEPAAFAQFRFDLGERNAFLVLTGLGHEDVLKILPERLVLLKVELYGHLAAFSVGDKLDSGHGSLSSLAVLTT